MRETASPTRPFTLGPQERSFATTNGRLAHRMGIDEMAVTFDELHQRLKMSGKSLSGNWSRTAPLLLLLGRRRKAALWEEEEGASEAFELEKRLALEKRLMDILAEVEHALRKFEKGTTARVTLVGGRSRWSGWRYCLRRSSA